MRLAALVFLGLLAVACQTRGHAICYKGTTLPRVSDDVVAIYLRHGATRGACGVVS